MSLRATTWAIWLFLFCVAPVPYTLGASETAPALRLSFFAVLISALRASEGGGGWIWNTFLALAVTQSVFYVAFFYFTATFVARLFARADARRRRWALLATTAAIAVATATACLVPIYATPISSIANYSTLLGILR